MLFAASLVENRPLGPSSFVLRLGGARALSSARPGQFVMLRGQWGRDPLLPRAFSILRVSPQDGECEILVKAMGRGTRLLAELVPGATLSVLGPLGRPFPEPQAGRTDLLVAGGVGLAPLLWYAEVAHERGLTTELFYGARTATELCLLDEIERTGSSLHVATEDGSFQGRGGVTGRVTAALRAYLEPAAPGPNPHVLTCGPNPMMKAVVQLASAHHLPCLVSVEGEMACGIGACLGCAIPLVAEAGGTRPFGYACVDGPVFDAARIVLP